MSNAYDNASLLVTPNGYEAGTIFSAKPTDGSGDLSFSRASTALRRNSAGLWESVANNVPRLKYPVGGGCPSWLFEPQATNYAQYSANISAYSSYLATISTSISNDLINGQSSYLLYPSSSAALAGQIFMALLSGITDGETITIQAKVKAEGKTWAYLGGITAGFAPLAWFNLSTGVVGTVTAGVTAKISAESNGYYTISATAVAPVGTLYSVLGSTDSDNTSTNTASGTNGIRVAYIGVEKGSIATSPIITTTAAVTRLEDVATTASKSKLTSTNFTLAIKLKSGINISTGNPFLGIDDAYFVNGVYLLSSSTGNGDRWRAFVRRSSVSTEILADSLGLLITGQTIVLKVDGTQVKVFLGGSLITTNTLAGTMPVLPNVLMTSANMLFEQDLFMTYNSALSDTECINLSNL
jgi:hypothetical protein